MSDEQRIVWEKWRKDLHVLEQVKVRRCFKSENFSEVKHVSLHHFSDASSVAYGQCSYLRLEDNKGKIDISFHMGKSRVAPLEPMSIPRLEISAAVVSVRVANMLKEMLEIKIDKEYFFQVVLGYLRNESKQFHIFVANRIQTIKEGSHLKQCC